MIAALTLNNYGKFFNREISFNPVTVVTGPNEAGKTTIYDALFEKLCNPAGNSTFTARLRDRYGKNRAAELRFTGSAVELDASEFLNLFSIRAGDLSISPSDAKKQNSDWMKNVKARLFSGKIDPQAIQTKLMYLAKDDSRISHARLKLEKEQTLSALTEELSKLVSKRQELLQREKENSKRENDLIESEKAIERTEKNIRELSLIVEREEKSRKRKNRENTLKAIRDLSDFEERAETLRLYETDEISEFSVVRKEVETSRIMENRCREILRFAAMDHESFAIEQEKAEKNIRQTRDEAELAFGLEERVKKYVVPQIVKRSYNFILLALGIIFFAGCIAAGAVVSGLWIKSGVIAFGVLTAAGIAVMSKKNEKIPDRDSEKDFIRQIVSEWNRRCNDKKFVFEESLPALIGFFESVKAKLDIEEKTLKQLNDNTSEACNRKKQAQHNLDAALEKLELSRKQELQWLADKKVMNAEDYVRKIEERKNIIEKISALSVRIDEMRRAMQQETTDDLKNTCLNDIAILEKDNIQSVIMPDTEYADVRKKLFTEMENQKKLNETIKTLTGSSREERGGIRESFGEISENIRKTQEAAARINEDLNEYKTDRKAASLAAQIFSDILQDENIAFLGLAAEIAGSFEGVLENRKVHIDNLGSLKALMSDAGGEERNLEFLSTGTRDSFMLAAKLVLARKARPETSGVLVLDEPFLSFDSQRRISCLKMLKNFKDKTRWQIILFTKELFLADEVKSVFVNDVGCCELAL